MPLLAVNNNALRITGTFLDEIFARHPAPELGREGVRDADFRYMKAIGIDTVIMIRCGYKVYHISFGISGGKRVLCAFGRLA